ncbi:MAG: hypothetical protein R3F43_01690 [bacterium]
MRELLPHPLSERIQRHARHMGVLRLLGVSGARPIEQIPPFPEPDLTAPVRLREEELIAFVATEPRPVERPRGGALDVRGDAAVLPAEHLAGDPSGGRYP